MRQGHRRQPPSPSRSNQRQQLRHRLGLAGPASPSPGPRRDRELERGGRGRRAAWQGRRTKVASLISWRDSASVNSKRSRAFLPASACGPGQEPGGAIKYAGSRIHRFWVRVLFCCVVLRRRSCGVAINTLVDIIKLVGESPRFLWPAVNKVLKVVVLTKINYFRFSTRK